MTRGSDPSRSFRSRRICGDWRAATLAFKPGENWTYGMSIDVLGGVLGAIEGDISDVEAMARKYVLEPLGDEGHALQRRPIRARLGGALWRRRAGAVPHGRAAADREP